MPYPVHNLIENKPDPLVVNLMTPVIDALSDMLDNDFSQLPVVDKKHTPIGMVTYQTITRTLRYVDCKIEELLVSDVFEQISKTQIFSADDNLFDMLDRLRDTNAILIVDADDKLIGIVTSFDSTEYFRMRAEDMMHVEDIESILKDHVLAAFTSSEGNLDQQRLNAAVEKVTISNQPTIAEYGKALNEYQTLTNRQGVNQSAMRESYDKHLKISSEVREFSDLTLYDYIQLLLHPNQKEYFLQVFQYPPERIRKLLHEVRETRNDLAHFREISSKQRDQLIYCKGLLEKTPVGIAVDWPVAKPETEVTVPKLQQSIPAYLDGTQSITPTDEEDSPTESKYTALVTALQRTHPENDSVSFSFDEINEILNGGLPPSARVHRAWWANDSVGHVQSQLWLEAGWRTSYINMTEEKVVFTRIKALEKRYINFFSQLLAEMRKTELPIKSNVSVNGTNWMTIIQIPDPGPSAAVFVFSFTTKRRFRVELYIDTGEKEQNKAVFDILSRDGHRIEEEAGETITWERINKKRASRVAIYHAGHISDTEEELTQLRKWSTSTMISFYKTINPRALVAIKQVVGE